MKFAAMSLLVAVAFGGGAVAAEKAAAPGGGSRMVAALAAGKKQTVVAYGTSLTAGGGWVTQVQNALDKRYPGRLTLINSGSSGQWSKWGLENLDERVIAKKPDAVFIEFAVNDAVARFSCSVAQSRTHLETMINRILKARPACEIILMTMTPADAYPKGHGSYRDNLPAYYQMVRDVARDRHLVLVDNDPNWRALRKADKEKFARFVPDSIHPVAEGCREVVTPEILNVLGVPAD